jgi:hypothetical protein
MASARRIRFGALALSLAVVLGACGSKSATNDKTSGKTTTSSTAGASTPTGGDGSSTTATAPTGTTAKGATATTAKGSTSTTASHALTTAAPDPNAVPGPAKTGTYGYAQTGSSPDGSVPAHGTLVVSGDTTESFARYYDTSKGPQTLTYVFQPDGPFVTAATISAKGVTITCKFASPVPLPPWPPTPGRTFSGSATCSSGITATIAGSVTSRSGDLVGIHSTVHATGSGLDVTVDDTESWSISLRVPRSSHQTYSGTALGSPVSGDVSSTLTSTP